MFTGKVELPQVDLDLVEIDGGGSCPTQFDGTSSDGKDVYIRYRGGCLSIKVDGEEIYTQDFGPYLHGDILLEQVSELTGLTVQGKRLSLSPSEFERRAKDAPLRDFSGRTLYLDQTCYWSLKGMESFVNQLLRSTKNSRLISMQYHRPPQKSRSLFSRRPELSYDIHWSKEYRKASTLPTSLVVPPDGLQTDVPQHFEDFAKYRLFMDSMLRHLHIPTRDGLGSSGTDQNQDYETFFRSYFGSDVIVGAQHSVISGECRAGDEDYEKFLRSASSLFERHSAQDIEIIDLETRKKVGEEQTDWRYTLDLKDWCAETDNRFLGIYKADYKSGTLIEALAFRPLRSQ